MEYTVDYFIEFYEKIPKEVWATGTFCRNGKHCALGFLGVREKDIADDASTINHPAGKALAKLLMPVSYGEGEFPAVYKINDDTFGTQFKQESPKERILAALYLVKQNEALKEEQKIVNTEVVRDKFQPA